MRPLLVFAVSSVLLLSCGGESSSLAASSETVCKSWAAIRKATGDERDKKWPAFISATAKLGESITKEQQKLVEIPLSVGALATAAIRIAETAKSEGNVKADLADSLSGGSVGRACGSLGYNTEG